MSKQALDEEEILDLEKTRQQALLKLKRELISIDEELDRVLH